MSALSLYRASVFELFGATFKRARTHNLGALLFACSRLAWAQSGLLENATEAYRSNRPAEAVKLYREYLQSEGDRADVRVFLGAALLNLDQVIEAGNQARRAIELQPSLARAHTLAGRVFAAQRLWQQAQGEFDAAIRLSPLDQENVYFSGRAFLDANRFEDAIQQLQRAAALGAVHPRIFENLGIAYAALDNTKQANSAYRKAVSLAGKDYHPFYMYGQFLFEQQRLQESLANLREALRRNQDDEGVRFALARVLFHQGDDSDAAAILESVRDSRECRVHALLSRIYAKQRNPAELNREEKAIVGCTQEPL